MSGLEVLERKPNSEDAAAIEVILKHSGVENRIIGSPETVLRELLTYFSKIYPSIELVSKLVLSVDAAGCAASGEVRKIARTTQDQSSDRVGRHQTHSRRRLRNRCS